MESMFEMWKRLRSEGNPYCLGDYKEREKTDGNAVCVTCGTKKYVVRNDRGKDETLTGLCCDNMMLERIETAKLSSEPRARPPISTAIRTLILERDGHACVLCRDDESKLEIAHLLSVADNRTLGDLSMTDEDLNSTWNLAAMCFDCNRGLASLSVSPVTLLRIVRARVIRARNGKRQ